MTNQQLTADYVDRHPATINTERGPAPASRRPAEEARQCVQDNANAALSSLAEGSCNWKLIARSRLSHGAADHLLRYRAVPGCDGSSERDVHLPALLEGCVVCHGSLVLEG